MNPTELIRRTRERAERYSSNNVLHDVYAHEGALADALEAALKREERCMNLIKRIGRLDTGSSGEYAKTFLALTEVKP